MAVTVGDICAATYQLKMASDTMSHACTKADITAAEHALYMAKDVVRRLEELGLTPIPPPVPTGSG